MKTLTSEFMMATASFIAALSAINFGLMAPAQAASLTWTFQNTVFEDGATLNGSFDYDADTNRYGNFNFSIAGGSILPDFTYQGGLCSQVTSNPRTCIPDETQSPEQVHFVYSNYRNPNDFEERVFFLGFSQLLTNQGGTVSIPADSWGEVFGQRGENDELPSGPIRVITRGEVVAQPPGAAVPEPTTMVGLALAGGGLAYARRRKGAKPTIESK